MTGAGGYLGRRIARSFLEGEDARVVLWLREGCERARDLRSELASFGSRVELVHGDLTDPAPFAGVRPESIDTIVHAAAVTRFNVESDLAERVNVAGVRRLMEWARGCPRLERLTLLSTVYAHGLRAGALREELPPEAPGFANHYERSKAAAERVLCDEGEDLPWQIHRIATVIADDVTGRVGQINALHTTLKLLCYGLLSLVPGDAGTPLYFVTGDFAADAVRELSLAGRERAIYHVCPTRHESATLGRLIDIAFQCFERDPGFRDRRILRPLLCDAEAFAALSAAVDASGGSMVAECLRSVLPFAPQLFSAKAFANDGLVEDLATCALPDAEVLIERACADLLETRWGARPERRGSAKAVARA